MKTLLLCAGYGTRMGVLTKECPKPLLKVNDNRPIIDYTIEHLSKLGLTDIIINVHQMQDQFQQYASYAETKWNVKITLEYEQELLGSAGTVKSLYDKKIWNTDDLLVIYGDVISFHNHKNTLDFHKKNKNWLTILYHAKQISSLMSLRQDQTVMVFQERPLVNTNSGIYIVNKSLFEHSGFKNGKADFPKDVFPKMAGYSFFRALPHEGYRISIDTPEKLEIARLELLCQKN